MLMVLIAALLVATVPLFGGRLRALAQVRIRSFWLIGSALALQVLAISVVPTWPHHLLVAAHLASYVMAGWFVWLNRRVSGLPIVALGGALNAITIAVNGGTLPASPSALATAGIHPVAGDFNNSGVLAHPHLAWLGDVLAIPHGVPMANVFSIGDLLILVGLAYGLHHLCGSRLVRRSRRSAHADTRQDSHRGSHRGSHRNSHRNSHRDELLTKIHAQRGIPAPSR